jgi:hypothetical protein
MTVKRSLKAAVVALLIACGVTAAFVYSSVTTYAGQNDN